MNVWYLAMSSANTPALPESRIWEINLRESLLHMGHQVIQPNFDAGRMALECMGRAKGTSADEARARYSASIVYQVTQAHLSVGIDLFLSYLYSAMILPEAVESIRSLGIPTVNFYCNAVHQFELVREIAPHFDFSMFPEREAEAKYRQAGANPVHIQMAANPRFYRPYPVPRSYQVTFVGQKYLNRQDYLGFLFAHGVDVRVWGPGWVVDPGKGIGASLRSRGRRLAGRLWHFARRLAGQERRYTLPGHRSGPPLPDNELVRMYSRSQVSLGFSEVRDRLTGEIRRHIRLRDFEAPMSGAFYLTGEQEELAEYYEIGREIVCYDTKEELLDKVRYYLAHEHEAAMVRQAGLRRARRDHTWENRFRQLFTAIGLERRL